MNGPNPRFLTAAALAAAVAMSSGQFPGNDAAAAGAPASRDRASGRQAQQGDPTVASLVASLGGRNWVEATERLVEIGEPAVALLLAELRAGGQRAQRVCLPLARIGSPRAVDAVIDALAHADERVRIAAAAALRFVRTRRAADALAEAAAGGTDAVKRVAATSLGTIGDSRAVEPLRAMLQSAAWYVRTDAVRSLGGVRTGQATGLLLAALDDASAEVRPVARQALVAQGDTATAPLVAALARPSDTIRWQAAWVLGRTAPAEAADALLRALEDPKPMVRREAAVSLARIGAAHHPADRLASALEERLRHADPEVRLAAAWVLGELRSSRAAAALISALGDGAAGWMAASALGRLAAPEAARPLARALTSESVRTRRAAAWASSGIDAAGTATALQAALADVDPEVRYWSRQALARIGTPEAMRASASARPTPWDREARRCAPARSSAEISAGAVTFAGRRYRLYPDVLDARPDIPSPLTASDGTELVVATLHDGRFAVVPATLRPGDRQCDADGRDFPTLATAGLHAELELERAWAITGRSAGEITDLARPGALSVEGFVGADEDILDVLLQDNRTVMALGLTHPELARPLFHVWNMMRADIDLGRWNMADHRWHNVTAIESHGRTVRLVAGDTKGGQLSIFEDGLDGAFWIDIGRELTEQERAFLQSRYGKLGTQRMDTLVRLLTKMQTGEMEPHYAMWYGFYEGKTPWRTDPIAIAFIFGLRTIEEIEAAFPGRLYDVLTKAGHVS